MGIPTPITSVPKDSSPKVLLQNYQQMMLENLPFWNDLPEEDRIQWKECYGFVGIQQYNAVEERAGLAQITRIIVAKDKNDPPALLVLPFQRIIVVAASDKDVDKQKLFRAPPHGWTLMNTPHGASRNPTQITIEEYRQYLEQESNDIAEGKLPPVFNREDLLALATRMLQATRAANAKSNEFHWRAVIALLDREDFPQNVDWNAFANDAQMFSLFDALYRLWNGKLPLAGINIPTDEDLKAKGFDPAALGTEPLHLSEKALCPYESDKIIALKRIQEDQAITASLFEPVEELPAGAKEILAQLLPQKPSSNDMRIPVLPPHDDNVIPMPDVSIPELPAIQEIGIPSGQDEQSSEITPEKLKKEYIEVTHGERKIPTDKDQLRLLAIHMMVASHAEGERGQNAELFWKAIYALTRRPDFPQNIDQESFHNDAMLSDPLGALLNAWEAATGKKLEPEGIHIPTDEDLTASGINLDALKDQPLGLDDQTLNAFDVPPKLQELQRLQPALELLTPHGEVIPPEIQEIVDALMKPAPSTNDGIKEAPPSISAPDEPISELAQTPPVAPSTPNTETAPTDEERLYQSVPGFSALGTELQQRIVAEFLPPAIHLQKPTINGKSRPAIDFVTLAPRQEAGKKPLLVFCPTLKAMLVHPELQQVAKNLLTTYACSGWKIEKRASINANNPQLYQDQLKLLLGTKAPDETYRKAIRQEIADYRANPDKFLSRNTGQSAALIARRDWFIEHATPHDFKALKAINGNPDTAKTAATPPADYGALMDSALRQECDKLQAAFSNKPYATNKNATPSVLPPETPVATPNSTDRRASVLNHQAQNNGAFKPWAAQKKENVKAAFATAKRFCTEPQFAWNATRNAAITTYKNSPKILVGAATGYGIRHLAAGAIASAVAIGPTSFAFITTASVLVSAAGLGALASVGAKLVKDAVFDRQAFKQETYKQGLLKTAAWGAFGGLLGGIIGHFFTAPHETLAPETPSHPASPETATRSLGSNTHNAAAQTGQAASTAAPAQPVAQANAASSTPPAKIVPDMASEQTTQSGAPAQQADATSTAKSGPTQLATTRGVTLPESPTHIVSADINQHLPEWVQHLRDSSDPYEQVKYLNHAADYAERIGDANLKEQLWTHSGGLAREHNLHGLAADHARDNELFYDVKRAWKEGRCNTGDFLSRAQQADGYGQKLIKYLKLHPNALKCG